jgi:hypothetical protein
LREEHIAFTHGVETVVGTERRIAIRLWAINSRHSMRSSRDPPAPSGWRPQGFLARVSWMRATEIAKALGIGRASVYRVLEPGH